MILKQRKNNHFLLFPITIIFDYYAIAYRSCHTKQLGLNLVSHNYLGVIVFRMTFRSMGNASLYS